MVLNKESLLEKLDHITGTLLDSKSNFLQLRNACIELYDLFISVSEFEISSLDDQPLITSKGKAIAPSEAALCVQDVARTTFFLRGIHEAICDHLKIHDEPVNILYTGTGPFAALLTPLVTKFSAQQLKMSLIEINPLSFNYLKRVISYFELEPYVSFLENSDAVSFKFPSGLEPDIVICETMNAALKNEQQWSILSNILPQCNSNTLLIPGEIEVSLALLGKHTSPFEDMLYLGTLIKLNTATALESSANPGNIKVLSTGLIIELPSISADKYSQIAMVTKLSIYKEHKLTYNESALTIPVKIFDIFPGKPLPAELVFKYEIGKKTGFQFKIIK